MYSGNQQGSIFINNRHPHNQTFQVVLQNEIFAKTRSTNTINNYSWFGVLTLK